MGQRFGHTYLLGYRVIRRCKSAGNCHEQVKRDRDGKGLCELHFCDLSEV